MTTASASPSTLDLARVSRRMDRVQSIRRRYFVVLLTAVVGTIGSFGMFSAARSWDRRVAELSFQNTARDRLRIIDGDFRNATIVLQTLRALLESTERPITREQFVRFSLSQHIYAAGLRDTGWAPCVKRDDRAAFEQSARDEGLAGFEIREPGPDGVMHRAFDRDEYFPILYSEGDARVSRLAGLDLGFEPVRRAALRRTFETLAPSATPPLELVTVNGRQGGLLSFLAVGRAGDPSHALCGVVLGAFDAVAMIDSIVATKAALSNLEIYLFAPAAAADARPIYPRRNNAEETDLPTLATLSEGRHFSGILHIADQPWPAIFVPAKARRSEGSSLKPLVPLGTGMIMTLMVVGYLLVSVRRTAQLEALTTNLRRTSEELHHNMAQVSFLARHDQLTGLPNRVVFQERLQMAMGGLLLQRPFFLLYLDLDRFKPINDTFGHAAGDQVLREVAARMRACLRDGDALARLGGDEFGVIVRATDTPAGVSFLAERLIEVASEPYAIDGRIVTIGMSIGIAAAPQDGDTAELIQIRADQALYAAKDAGRGGVRFFSDTGLCCTVQ